MKSQRVTKKAEAKKDKKPTIKQSRRFSCVLEMEMPERVRKVQRFADHCPKCPLVSMYYHDEKYCPFHYYEISRHTAIEKVKTASMLRGNCPYWAIVHDKDDTRVHCHFVVEVPLKKTLNGFIKEWSYLLGVKPVRLSVNLEFGNGIVYAVRYLRHLDPYMGEEGEDKEKYPYAFGEVFTNEPERYNEYCALSVKMEGVTTRQLISLIAECSSLYEVIEELGIAQYMKYRAVVVDLWHDRNNILRMVGNRSSITVTA